MTRVACLGILAAATLVFWVPQVSANIPDPSLSVVPRFITVAPDGGGSVLNVTVQVNGALGGVDGAFVEIEFSEEATALLAWASPVPSGADVPVQTCPNRRYAKVADPSGTAVFHIAGGGCIRSEDFGAPIFVTQVRADDVVLAEREVNSPDVVNQSGKLCTELAASVCDGGQMTVGLADAVFHSVFAKSGAYEKCSDLAAPYGSSIELGDATVVTYYVKVGSSGQCDSCDAVPVPPGACCLPEPDPEKPPECKCQVMTEAQCLALHGDYKGNGTTCSPNPCPRRNLTGGWVSERLGNLGGQMVNPDSLKCRVALRVGGLCPNELVTIKIRDDDGIWGGEDLDVIGPFRADKDGQITPNQAGNEWRVPPVDADEAYTGETFFEVRDQSGKKIYTSPVLLVLTSIQVKKEAAYRSKEKTTYEYGAELGYKQGGIGGVLKRHTTGEIEKEEEEIVRSGVLDPIVRLEIVPESPLPPGWSVAITPELFELAPNDSLVDSLVVLTPDPGEYFYRVRTISEYPGGERDTLESDVVGIVAGPPCWFSDGSCYYALADTCLARGGTPGLPGEECETGALSPRGGGQPPSPSEVRLLAAPTPNPVTGLLTYSVRLPKAGIVRLDVFDVAGRRIRTLLDRELAEGTHTYTWDTRGVAGRPMASGVYYLRLEALGIMETRMFVLNR